MLRPWIVRRAVQLLGDGATAAEAAAETGLAESEVLALVAVWARAGNNDPIPVAKLAHAGGAAMDAAARASAAAAQGAADAAQADATANAAAIAALLSGGGETLTELGSFTPPANGSVQLPDDLETVLDGAFAGATAFHFRERNAGSTRFREFRIFKPPGAALPSGNTVNLAYNAAGWTLDYHANRYNVAPPAGVSWLDANGTCVVFAVTA